MRALKFAFCAVVAAACATAASQAAAQASAPADGDASGNPAVSTDAKGKANGRSHSNGKSNGKHADQDAPVYEDRLIDDGNLPINLHDDLAGLRSPDGWPRALRFEALSTRLDRNGVVTTENGVGIGAYLATPNYGFFTVDGTLRSDGGGTAVLWQRDVPFDGGWRANNGIGSVSTSAIDLARTQTRFVLPSSPLMGGSTEWRSSGGVQLVAAAGEPGYFSGIHVPRFERLGGGASTAGVNAVLAPGWTAGAQWIESHDTRITNFVAQPDASYSSRTLFGSAAWDGQGIRVQGNAITGNVKDGVQRVGSWIDAGVLDGRTLHTFGAFYIEPDLAWGNQTIANDVQGAYYRANYRSRQWLLDGGGDFVRPVSDAGISTTYLTGSARYQFNRDVGAGAGINWLHAGTSAWSAYVFGERNHPWGIGRLQLDTAEDSRRRDVQLKYEQTWAMPAATHLATAASVGRLSDTIGQNNRFRLQAVGGGDIAHNLSIDGNLTWTRSPGAQDPTAIYANVGLNWRFLVDWLLTVGYYENRTDTSSPIVVSSPIAPPAPFLNETLKDRGVFLTLRFDGRAGTPTMALGGPSGSGVGRITGVVYLDANENGRLDAGEAGAANVTVVLDGRFSVRTDSQGRFEFPSVVAGRHKISVMPDNLPLPWTMLDDRRDVDLSVRADEHVELGARRPR